MIYIILGFTAMVLLQIWLSKKDNRIVGLIQPISLFVTVLIYVLTATPDTTVNSVQKLAQMGYAVLYFNIPTIVLFIIYLAYQKPFSTKRRESDLKNTTARRNPGKNAKFNPKNNKSNPRNNKQNPNKRKVTH